MALSIDEFFTDSDLREGALAPAASIVRGYLEGGGSASAAAQAIITTLNNDISSVVYDLLENCIIGAVERVSETHTPALAQLTKELRDLRGRAGADALAAFDKSLAYALFQRWEYYGDPDPSNSCRDDSRREWANINSFAALLYKAGHPKLAVYGEDTLNMTLRRGEWRVNWSGPENKSDVVSALRGHLPAAMAWLYGGADGAGERLYQDCEGVRAKWSEWIGNLEWLHSQAQTELDADIRTMCEEAITNMRLIHA